MTEEPGESPLAEKHKGKKRKKRSQWPEAVFLSIVVIGLCSWLGIAGYDANVGASTTYHAEEDLLGKPLSVFSDADNKGGVELVLVPEYANVNYSPTWNTASVYVNGMLIITAPPECQISDASRVSDHQVHIACLGGPVWEITNLYGTYPVAGKDREVEVRVDDVSIGH